MDNIQLNVCADNELTWNKLVWLWLDGNQVWALLNSLTFSEYAASVSQIPNPATPCSNQNLSEYWGNISIIKTHSVYITIETKI